MTAISSIIMCLQKPEETVDSFINRLEKATLCHFAMLTEELITDQLVIDLKDHLDKFCILKVESLDLNKVLNICCSNEAANQPFLKLCSQMIAKLQRMFTLLKTIKFVKNDKNMTFVNILGL